MAMAYASCQDKQKKTLLLSRIELMLTEMRRCQERTFVWSDSLGRYFEARDVAPEAELRELKGSWKDFDDYKQDTMDSIIRYLSENPGCNRRITVTYFVPDAKKGGGKYQTVDDVFKYIDISDMSLCLKDGTRINKNDIYDLKYSD